jgi:hypothetical protein
MPSTPPRWPRGPREARGNLVFVTRVLPTGRAFLRRTHETMHELERKSWPLTITITHPLCAMSYASGRSYCQLGTVSTSSTGPWYGTRSGQTPRPSIGMGGHLGLKDSCTTAFSLPLPDRHLGKVIMFLETLALLTAIRTWSSTVGGGFVTCFIDNLVLAASLEDCFCRHRATQTLFREIFGLIIAP